MIINAKELHGLTIHAEDGEIGTVDQLYFDDETWAIRFLTVDTGGWLVGRQVLITPISVIRIDWEAKRLDVSLTKTQVEKSPDIDTRKPVSRQHEIAYMGYYGYPFYWGGSGLWGSAAYPGGLAAASLEPMQPPFQNQPDDLHLRSVKEVTGYHLGASDGEIGHVHGFLVDCETWAIRYMEIATRNWWPGKKVLVSPAWVERVVWEESKIHVALTREAIQTGPEYDETKPITREYESQLYSHYGRQSYWLREAERKASIASSRT